MKINEIVTSQGLPRVTWVQLMVKGSRGKRAILGSLAFGAAVGGLIGFFSGNPSNVIEYAVVGAVICLGIFAFGAAKAPLEQFGRDMRKPVLKKVKAEAEIARNEDGYFTFSWMFRDPSGQIIGNTLPIDDFETLEFGLSSEWYAGPHEQGDFSNMFVIVLHSTSLGTQCVAAHAGTKAEISTLHAVLTRALVVAHRAASSAQRTRQMTSSTVSDELPEKL